MQQRSRNDNQGISFSREIKEKNKDFLELFALILVEAAYCPTFTHVSWAHQEWHLTLSPFLRISTTIWHQKVILCDIFPQNLYIFTRSSWKVAWGGQTKCHESEETNVNILSFFVLYFCEKNAVMKSNGVKSISCVYLRRVRKAMWTHRAPPNPGPSSLLLCKASQRRSSSSLREKLFQNLFFFEKLCMKNSYKYHIILIVFLSMLNF